MAMSWGWTPLCQIGGGSRYRINTLNEATSHPSVVLSRAQCGIVPPPQLPPETSIVLTSQASTESSQPPAPSIPSTGFNTPHSVTVSYPSVTSASAAERAVRRSPRLANSRVTYRDEAESQNSSRRRNQLDYSVPQPTMWNSSRSQGNASQQEAPSKNYGVYNYEGQIVPCLNSNTSVTMTYNNNRSVTGMSQSRYPLLGHLPVPKANVTVKTVATGRVTIKNLDFFEFKTSLVQEDIRLEGMGPAQRTFTFILSQGDAKNLLDKKRKHPFLIQLRFCKLDSSSDQNDYYPATHQIAVNHRFFLLPGLETMPRGSMRPMDITPFCHINSQACNFITVRCMESCKIFINVVQKFTAEDLLSRLKEKYPVKEEDTINDIKKKLQADQADDGIAAATLQFSLLCPLSRIRIKLPCRASTCTHLQCFDAATYLQLNECKPKWSCPVCYQPALYRNLIIDGYFKKIIDENVDTDKIELQPDGTWTLVDGASKKKPHPVNDAPAEKSSQNHNTSQDPQDKTVVLDSDDDVMTDSTQVKSQPANSNPSPRKTNSPEIVTLSDDDSADADAPQVEASYPTYNSTPIGRTTSGGTNNTGLNANLSYINDLLGIGRPINPGYVGIPPVDRSNNLYIPLMGHLPNHLSENNVTVSCILNETRTNSNDQCDKSSDGSNKSTSRARRSKSTRVQRLARKPIKKKTLDSQLSALRKRRRILSESSDSSESNSEKPKKSKSKVSRKKATRQLQKQKKKNKSSDDEASSDASVSKGSSVNLISSSNSSGSNSGSSNSSSTSSSSSSDSSAHESDDSFTLGSKIVENVIDPSESSSRVLRSAIDRQKRKRK